MMATELVGGTEEAYDLVREVDESTDLVDACRETYMIGKIVIVHSSKSPSIY